MCKSGPKMECFLCDSVQNVELIICNTSTKYRNIPLTSILQELAGNEIEIVIENTDAICKPCQQLLDQMDLLHTELNNIENIFVHKLHRKYRLDNGKRLPAIRVDEQTINLYSAGEYARQFQCNQCTFSTDFADNLMLHRLLHQNAASSFRGSETANELLCEFCDIILPSNELFNQHQTTFHPPNNDAINQNNTEIADTIHLLPENDLQCPVSEVNVPLKVSYYHQKFDILSYQQECRKVFPSEKRYAAHRNIGHFNCDKCNLNCRNAKTLTNHIKRKHTPHNCTICNKQLNSLVSYNAHMTVHGFNQKFICDYCNKGFRAKSLLAIHIVIHSKQLNFTCHICGQSFVHQRAHRLHLKWHENPRPHQCHICEKTFTHGSHLATHFRTHTGERPNVCQYCEKRFITSTKLKSHLSIHTGNYLHSCSICKKGYDKRYKYVKMCVFIPNSVNNY